jgi:hypothetical protein
MNETARSRDARKPISSWTETSFDADAAASAAAVALGWDVRRARFLGWFPPTDTCRLQNGRLNQHALRLPQEP